MNPPIVQNSGDGAVLTIYVQPKSSRTECVGRHGDALKIRVAAPPVGGAANDELIRFLAEALCIPAAGVVIESGAGGRRKRVRVYGVTAAQVTACLIQKRPAVR